MTTAIDQLVDDYVAGMPALDSETARIAAGLWRLLAEGTSVTVDTVAERLGLSKEEVLAALDGPLDGTYLTDDDGRIYAFWALSLPDQTSPHRLTVGDQTLYAWCGPDTLFLPLLLGQKVRVQSSLIPSGEPLSLTIDCDRLVDVDAPDGTVLSFVPMAPEGIGDSVPSILSTYCHHMLFFPDADTGRRWAHEHHKEDLVFVPLEQAFDACQAMFRRILGDALEAKSPACGCGTERS